MVNSEKCEVVADEVEHRRDRSGAEQLQPFAFWLLGIFIAELGREPGTDRLQILARVHALGDFADIPAQRLPVAEVHRACERVDLSAGVIYIIFLGDPEASSLQHPCKRVADNGAPAMAHVKRPGRVGRDIFDVDPLGAANVRLAVGFGPVEDGAQFVAPGIRREPEVDEPRSGDLDGSDSRESLQLGRDHFGEGSRVRLRLPGEHHGRIGCEVAMSGVARRLDRDRLAIDSGRNFVFGLKLVEHSVEERGIAGVKAQFITCAAKPRV